MRYLMFAGVVFMVAGVASGDGVYLGGGMLVSMLAGVGMVPVGAFRRWVVWWSRWSDTILP